jgi:hypothetical protein
MQLTSEMCFVDAVAIGRPTGESLSGALLSGYFAAGRPAFSCATVSFSTPELSDVLCGTTDIGHDFS